MKFSKLQMQILELALVEYEKPANVNQYGEAWYSRAVMTRDLVAKIYGVVLGGRWFCREGGKIFKYEPHAALSMCRGPGFWFVPSTASDRERYARGSAAVSRAVARLRSAGLVEPRKVRLTRSGAEAARDAKTSTVALVPTRNLINQESLSVTSLASLARREGSVREVRTCACGARLDALRSTRRYCSPACRQTAFRMRQALDTYEPDTDTGRGLDAKSTNGETP